MMATDSLNSKHLLQLAEDTTELGRYRLAHAVSRFFEQKDLKDTERYLAIDIMMSLIHQAELDLREALAERLSVLGGVPPEIIIFLANDAISVARPVLQNSKALNDTDLIYIIASKGSEYWQSIALRGELSPAVAERLIATADVKTALNLIDNTRSTLSADSVRKLVKISLKAEELHLPLLRRPEINAELAVHLYVCVSQALRHEISRRFSISPAAVEASLEDLLDELSLEAKGLRYVTREMKLLAKRFAERGEISPVMMVKTLRRGQHSFFIALFAERLGFTPEIAARLMEKDGGRAFALACRSIGMMKTEFASIFLLSRGAHADDKIVDQRELASALEYYDTIKEFDVMRVMKSWTKNPEMI
jgi:uncharacterized protein (DUF2336 family)